jgi:hypothetical protein
MLVVMVFNRVDVLASKTQYIREVGARAWRRWLVIAGLCGALPALAGCGGSTPQKKPSSPARESAQRTARTVGSSKAPPGPCAAASRDAVARFVARPPAGVSIAASTGNNGMPQCTFTARPANGGTVSATANGGTVSATANVDNGPQPYFILERTAVETSQLFGPKRFVAAPIAINNLGIEADWFPNLNQLMSTDGLRLITVTMHWPGAPLGRQIGLAEALSRTYLKKLSPQEVDQLAKGAPSGG